jgi:hypothetical protein
LVDLNPLLPEGQAVSALDNKAWSSDIRAMAEIDPVRGPGSPPAEAGPSGPGPEPGRSGKPSSSVATRFVIILIVAVIAFLAGFIPSSSKSHSLSKRVSDMRRELALSQIENKLAAATLDANLGQHERARQSASQFFTQLRDEIDQDKNSALSQSQRDQANQLLNQRDDLITLLARGDPSSSKRLADLYGAFRKLVGTAPPPK